MNKKKKSFLWMILLLTILLIVFVMCAPQTSSGSGSDNANIVTNWNKIFDGNEGNDYARSVAIDSNNNVYVAGYGENLFWSNSDEDWWIKKFNSNGNEDTTNWDKKINGSGYISDKAYSIAIDSNNNIYVVGSSSINWWIKKFDSNGNEDTTNWDKIIDGGHIDSAKSVAIDSNNNVYIVGYGEELISSSSGYDWWIKKFNSNGNEVIFNWDKKFDGNGDEDHANSVAIDSNNNVYVAGYGYNLISSSSGRDWWIKKFNSNGNEDTTNWNKMFDGNGGFDQSYSVAIDSNNNVYIVGRGDGLVTPITNFDWWIKKFDSNGNEDTTNWNKKIDWNYDDNYAFSVAIDSNDNVYVVGNGYNLVSGSLMDWWIKKFDSNGNEDITNWNLKLDGNNYNDTPYSVAIDSNDNVYVTGYGYILVSSNSFYDWWIKKIRGN